MVIPQIIILKNVSYSCFYKYLGEDYKKRTTDNELKPNSRQNAT